MSTTDSIPDPLKSWFAQCPFAVVAFSGGVDSSLVAWLARKLLGPERSLAVISASPSLKLSDLDAAKQICTHHDIPLQIVHTQELLDPAYFLNPTNRCFACKHTLYTELEPIALARKAWVLNGTNTDDLGDYRPGLQAAAQFSVRSPLKETGMDKKAVRTLAEAVQLECWNKPAAPCLASRIPYGERVTEKKLRQIEDGEAELIQRGFPIVRLRHQGDTACIEVPPDRVQELLALEKELAPILQDIGFHNLLIDREGFVSGKLNRDIKPTS